MDSVSDDDKLRICRNFFMQAPAGEFDDVFNDIRVLVQDDNLVAGASSTFAAYNEDQFVPVAVEGVEGLVLVTKYGRVGHNKYYDPRTKTIFKYDHLKKTSTLVGDSEKTALIELSEAVRWEFEKRMKVYVKENYPRGCFTVYAPKDDVLSMCIEAHIFEKKKFLNGRWRSEWTINCKNGQVYGKIRADVHSFDECNILLKTQKDVVDKVEISEDFGNVAQLTLKIVKKAENAFQKSLNENYDTMSKTSLKALRRILPVTRAKMDWESAINYQLAEDISRKTWLQS